MRGKIRIIKPFFSRAQDEEKTKMFPEKKRPFFRKIYLYMIGLGLMFFGVFVICFREYSHPIYGYMNFGVYHKYIGIGFLLLSIAMMRYIRTRP